MKPKAIIVSGYFNPIHKGHIEYFQNAKSKGNKLFVIVNNDFQIALNGSNEFQDEKERCLIVDNLRLVDQCFLSVDEDRTVCETIKSIYNKYSDYYSFSFVNRCDRNNLLIPEQSLCENLNIELINALDDMVQTSSLLLK